MGQVTVEVGGHQYELACKDGEEDKLRASAAVADEKAQEAMKAVGRTGETRTLLFATILLADELKEARARLADAGAAPTIDEGTLRAVESLAERAETLAAKLEKAHASA
ncbi:MAG: cell division protein ZapA [Sphingomonadaceae bacterium]|nr:cell division protein ZapA [Sphingomonadaceae bacterium]